MNPVMPAAAGSQVPFAFLTPTSNYTRSHPLRSNRGSFAQSGFTFSFRMLSLLLMLMPLVLVKDWPR
jgi:hypothetical protein